MKIKCLLLAICLLLPCFAVNAASDTALDFEHEKHISFLSQLDINEGINNSADEAITRAEFTAMIVRAANAGNISVSHEPFADCENNVFKKEIFIANALGITNGTSEATFSPDEGVSESTAAKMLITALGYEDLAIAKGGYPTGYLSLAYSLDIFDNVVCGEKLSVKNAYTLIYNTMLVDIPIVAEVDEENFVTQTIAGRNLLTENFHLSHTEGVLKSADGYSLLSSEITEKGKVYISDINLNADTELRHYFGLDVDIWYDDTDTVRVILEKDSNNSVTVKPEDIIEYSGGSLYTSNENNKEKRYSLELDFSFVENGRVVAHTADSFNLEEGELTLIDNDGDGKYEIVLAQKPEYFVISSLNNTDKTIYDKYSIYKSISFEDDANKYYHIEIDGESADFSALTSGMVCEIYMSADKEVCLVRANKDFSISGTLEERWDDNVVVSGTTYRLNSYFKDSGVDLNLGAAYTFLIAPDSTITAISGSTDSDVQYGYVLGYKEATGLASNPQIKLLTADNSVQAFGLASQLHFNGEKLRNTDSSIAETFVSGDIPIYQLVRYRAADGIITMLDTETVSSFDKWDQRQIYNDEDSLTKFVSRKQVRYNDNSMFGIPNISMERAVVFLVPENFEAGKKYDDSAFLCDDYTSYLRAEALYYMDAFDYDEDFCPGAIIIYFTSADATTTITKIPVRATPYIVRDITDAIDNDGNEVKLLKVYGNGVYEEHPIAMDTYTALLEEEKDSGLKVIPSSGDIVRIAKNTQGYVNGIAVDGVYDSDTGSVTINFGKKNISKTGNEVLTYWSGNVLSQSGSYMLINADSVPTDSVWDDGRVNLKLNSSLKYVVYNTKTGLARAGTRDDIVAGLNKDDPNASYVVVKASYYIGQIVFIYEN